MINKKERKLEPMMSKPPSPGTTPESKEAPPTLELNILGPCKTPEGPYISLNGAQRHLLEEKGHLVRVGSLVRVFDTATKAEIGIFVVGKGRKGQSFHDCYLNLRGHEQPKISVQPLVNDPENPPRFGLPLKRELENDGRHAQRRQIIKKRFPNRDPELFIGIPTNVAIALKMEAGQKPTVRKIGVISLEMLGHTREIIAVPTGDSFALTSTAEAALSLPKSIESLTFEVRDGKLVVL